VIASIQVKISSVSKTFDMSDVWQLVLKKASFDAAANYMVRFI